MAQPYPIVGQEVLYEAKACLFLIAHGRLLMSHRIGLAQEHHIMTLHHIGLAEEPTVFTPHHQIVAPHLKVLIPHQEVLAPHPY